ncbi:hypothetical protein GUITHDRAFT_104013 [Guillardia theta CCMP2712]|uniref:Uncharacterized protein n=1 Tax=Guillardia theta (strain CCMP2712) TaxID=905079 RepID=L1JPJ9_GUITC|nr:hypothetical protein GUITHDRAFT_104013 [Guillardia theta CCMP2712]EKX50199.1 hypothetical protein GUITHDRAFT_104013 [Guillardia theta CCMP2712]|eukprot:XP_005837179.1 hypothetical protein GUITHDRAFT_104013 [Guillardia theta CCMP2712]
MEEKDISTNEVQFVDSSERCIVVLPFEEDVKSRNIECEESKEDVEKALQLHVALMKPSLLELPAVAEKEEEREGTENEELDEPKVAWKNAMDETIEEEWEDEARS